MAYLKRLLPSYLNRIGRGQTKEDARVGILQFMKVGKKKTTQFIPKLNHNQTNINKGKSLNLSG